MPKGPSLLRAHPSRASMGAYLCREPMPALRSSFPRAHLSQGPHFGPCLLKVHPCPGPIGAYPSRGPIPAQCPSIPRTSVGPSMPRVLPSRGLVGAHPCPESIHPECPWRPIYTLGPSMLRAHPFKIIKINFQNRSILVPQEKSQNIEKGPFSFLSKFLKL